MRETELVRVFNFNIAEVYYCVLDKLQMVREMSLEKQCACAELSTYQKPKA